MLGKIITTQVKLIKFVIFPAFLGAIASFIGPAHHAQIYSLIGGVIGFAIQHRVMYPALKDAIQASNELFDKIFEDKD